MVTAAVRLSPTVTGPKFRLPVTLITLVGVGAGVGVGGGKFELLHAPGDGTRSTGSRNRMIVLHRKAVKNGSSEETAPAARFPRDAADVSDGAGARTERGGLPPLMRP